VPQCTGTALERIVAAGTRSCCRSAVLAEDARGRGNERVPVELLRGISKSTRSPKRVRREPIARGIRSARDSRDCMGGARRQLKVAGAWRRAGRGSCVVSGALLNHGFRSRDRICSALRRGRSCAGAGRWSGACTRITRNAAETRRENVIWVIGRKDKWWGRARSAQAVWVVARRRPNVCRDLQASHTNREGSPARRTVKNRWHHGRACHGD